MVSGERDAVELEVSALILLLWKRRWLIVVVSGLFAVAGVVYALMATEWYRADVILAPSKSDSMSGSLGQLGSLASIAGINLNGDASDEIPLAVLGSRELAREFIEKEQLLPVLFEKDWDAATGTWKNSVSDDPPDMRDAVKFLDEDIRSVSENTKTGLVTLSITWTDADQAARWASRLVEMVNHQLREQALEESNRNIAFLEEQINEATVASLQRAVSQVLESELQRHLLARGREEFAFRTVDPAVPPKEKIRPRRSLIAAFSLILGFSVSIAIALAMSAVPWLREAQADR